MCDHFLLHQVKKFHYWIRVLKKVYIVFEFHNTVPTCGIFSHVGTVKY